MNPPTLNDLNPNEYIQRFHYYPFMVNLGKCNANCITREDSVD